MLYHLQFLTRYWGPFRIFGSHLTLLALGTALSAALVLLLLPKFFDKLPRDGGKQHTKDGNVSKGKPTSAGFYLLWFSLPVMFLVLPFSLRQWGIVLCLFAAMYAGHLDDKSKTPWGRKKKLFLDFIIAAAASLLFCGFQSVEIWLPFVKGVYTLPWLPYSAFMTFCLIVAMNATNCTDGVDGLAGSLTLLSLLWISFFLYGVIGHEDIAAYLLIPHHSEGARWGILCAVAAGATAGYLWHNANPSSVLMGDAGSRPLGLLTGIAAFATGNPFVILAIMPVIILDGGPGLIKLPALKILKICGCNTGTQDGDNKDACRVARFLRSVRCPIHDHMKEKLLWSNGQVLMRFMLLQSALIPFLFLLLIKIR